MGFLSQYEIEQFKNKLSSDLSSLGKIYKAKKSKYQKKSVEHSLVDDLIAEGWNVEKSLNTKTILRKEKTHSRQFEEDIWCQFYDLGYRV